MKIEAHRKILFLAIVLVLLSPLPANATCEGGSFSEFKLTAETPVPTSRFGQSVAVSGDTMVIGAPGEQAAYVFEYEEGKWNPKARLTPNGSTSMGLFGLSVAISGDTVMVGDPFPFGGNLVYVFKRVGDSWNEYDPNDYSPLILNTGDFTFGFSLAFDGSTLVVGTRNANLVYVYNLDGDNWPEEGTRLPALDDPELSGRFGFSVAVSGSKVVVGAPRDESTTGSAYVFDYVYDIDEEAWKWLQTEKLVAADGQEHDDFGFSVAIHQDTVVVGAPKESSDDVSNPGAVYVYNLDGDNGTQQEDPLTANDSDDDEFGYSVAIKDSTLLVGAPNDTDTGAAYLFKYNGGNWVKDPVQPNEPGLEEGDQFGWSVAFDGGTIAVGAPLSNLEVPDQTDVDLNNEVLKAGAAYVFTANDETPVSVVQSTLGRSRHRFFPAWEIFEFTAARGDKATLIFEADANGSNNHGKGVSVFVRDKIRGERFFMKKRWALGTPMEMELPADGEYRVYVFGHPWFFRSKGFRGDYVLKLKLEGTCGELRKVSRRNKWK
jgi:hypothetical protein